jgi:hypothetical protein
MNQEVDMILERHIQKLAAGVTAEQFFEMERKWDALEKRCGGAPPKKHFMTLSSAEEIGTIVWEREWASFTAWEAANEQLWADPETRTLVDLKVTTSERLEIYQVIPRAEIYGDEKT